MIKNLTKDSIKVIGLTGGMGSGKSTAASIMSEFGGRIIDADKIAKELMKPGRSAYNSVRECFGDEILAPDGEIDRTKLGNIVFNDRQRLADLNRLTHRLVGEEIRARIDELKEEMTSEPLKAGELRFIVLDVPIPVEEGFFDVSNTVWAVISNDDLRIERIMRRNGISEQDAERRLAAQMSNREYAQIADVIIENERDITELRDFIAKELVHYFDVDTDRFRT